MKSLSNWNKSSNFIKDKFDQVLRNTAINTAQNRATPIKLIQ